MKRRILFPMVLIGLSSLVGCGSDSTSFSVLPDGDNFQQNSQSSDSKIDILWVVDNSGSMQSSQDNLAQNFPTFIQEFSSRGLDFQLAVTATDSFIALSNMTNLYNALSPTHYLRQSSQASWAQFRDGGSTHSGVRILNPSTPNLNTTFVTNASLGINGLGDERPLQSMKTSLRSTTYNSGFVRQNSFLAVIILTDEDDFSHDGTSPITNYSNTNLHSVESYKTDLDQLTGSSGGRNRYNVHSIAIQDSTCLSQLNAQIGGRRIAQRVNQLADLTGGTKVSLCSDFAEGLNVIADNIIELSTQFYLSRVPIESTIVVRINGTNIPNISSSPGNGWWYNATSNSILFQGTAVPPQGAVIEVNFDPVSLGS